MELQWIDREVGDGDGGMYRIHYLVDSANQQCLATITEPRLRNILWVTDLRIAGVDRSWMTLDAGKRYCESVAEMENMRAAQELEEKLTPPQPAVVPVGPASLFDRLRRYVARIV